MQHDPIIQQRPLNAATQVRGRTAGQPPPYITLHLPSITVDTVPADSALQAAQIFSPHHSSNSQSVHRQIYGYNLPISGSPHPVMPPHGNNPGGNPNSAHGVNSNSSPHSVFMQSNPHGSSPYILTPAFAQNHHEPPPSAAINSPRKRHDSAHNTATPACGNFYSPSNTRTRSEGSFLDALPFASLPAAQTQSRLPPNTVARLTKGIQIETQEHKAAPPLQYPKPCTRVAYNSSEISKRRSTPIEANCVYHTPAG
ncbi:hypothetical protein BU25DRAFT_478746 [Macroventuria anomochaeta]|uniref:Uncharacterized protein n=1 Tax=Macroventuria anomochaeta TaxID=301207 RepID=A0ACB6RMA2_9PLEO|nr:uncharacterized protein BU25DRAFT_478746 [Macroventuria anomochaeta]KAF2623151.1 hypothetical protein BU25DRAFT_478746 [Macroventuria anomochaeta]